MLRNSIYSPESRGFTLLEVLITLALLSVLFAVGSSLLHGAFRALRVVNQKAQANEAMQSAVSRICGETRECQNITAADSTHLVLEILDPAYTTGPTPLDPYHANNLLVVTYTTDGRGKLVRTVVPKSGGTTETQIVADGIQGLSAAWTPGALPGTLTLSLSVSDEILGLRSLTSEVYPMALP